MENTRVQEIFFIGLCDNLIKNFKDKDGIKSYFYLVTKMNVDVLYNIYLKLKRESNIDIVEISTIMSTEKVGGIRKLSQFFPFSENRIVEALKEFKSGNYLPTLKDPSLNADEIIKIKAFIHSHCLFNRKTNLINKYILD